jgi:hypothetical protein
MSPYIQLAQLDFVGKENATHRNRENIQTHTLEWSLSIATL